MKNKTVGQVLLSAIIVALFTAFLVEESYPALADNMYMLSGLVLMIFGSWASILLIKSDK